jgi:beta-N-acetylhexosaminidase
MRKKNRFALIIIVIVLTLASVTQKSLAYSKPDLDKKIGQMIMIGFRGTELTHNNKLLKKHIANGNIGGVIILPYNIRSKPQLNSLISEIKMINCKYPLLIAIDQEGGKVSRLNKSNGFCDFPSAKDVAENYTLSDAYMFYKEMALILKETGINLNLAPVVDLNINPVSPAIGKLGRSFSKDPKITVCYASEFIKAHSDVGTYTAIKHFPGHGSSLHDSHEGHTDVTKTWQQVELEPYRALLANNTIDAVMTAHIFNTNLDCKYPASLSKKIIQGILRDGMNYNGVVISDDLQMGAIAKKYSFDDIVINAVNAGTDILLFAGYFDPDPNIALKARRVILNAVKEGRIATERIEESYKRIIELKNPRKISKRFL